MDLSSAVRWWEEWQLRILVLGSLGVQFYLAFFASARKKHIRPLFRFSIWLAYLAGDALAIYALATLFNRQRKLRYTSADASHNLEVLWAPILLMHLGGQMSISAYNIEDNELWRRHIVTAVSQVAVALYVFCKSWSPLADGRLLAAAILLFILGVFKCFERPLALRRNSFPSLVSSFHPSPRAKTINREVELEEYIGEARDFVRRNKRPLEMDADGELRHLERLSIPNKLFVDSAYVHADRITNFQSFWSLDNKAVYKALCTGLSQTFDLIYSKVPQGTDANRVASSFGNCCSIILWLFTLTLPIVPISLFHSSNKEAYRSSDIKVTFSLLYITYLLEISSFLSVAYFYEDWADLVAQHSLIGFLARNRRHPWLMGIAELLKCKGLLDTYFCLRPCNSSEEITNLVQDHFIDGWMNRIRDVESFRKFGDSRGHLTLDLNPSEEILGGSIEKPFDECIVLWHLATDFCFYHSDTNPDNVCARLCREISNYMMHLLFASPEMLLPGSRSILLTNVYRELEDILHGDDLSLVSEKQLTERIIEKVKSKEGFVQDAWVLAEELMRLGDNKNQMSWEVIRGVWVEMLCFSAGRCRGYLHAKSLGSGGEYLTFVSLLMAHAGLETFAERQQRVQLRLPKEVRKRILMVKARKKEIEEAARNKVSGASPEVEVVVSPS